MALALKVAAGTPVRICAGQMVVHETVEPLTQ